MGFKLFPQLTRPLPFSGVLSLNQQSRKKLGGKAETFGLFSQSELSFVLTGRLEIRVVTSVQAIFSPQVSDVSPDIIKRPALANDPGKCLKLVWSSAFSSSLAGISFRLEGTSSDFPQGPSSMDTKGRPKYAYRLNRLKVVRCGSVSSSSFKTPSRPLWLGVVHKKRLGRVWGGGILCLVNRDSDFHLSVRSFSLTVSADQPPCQLLLSLIFGWLCPLLSWLGKP